MKKKLLLFIAGTILLALQSCAPRIPFTRDIRHKENLSDEEIQRIQFYPSQDIVLQRGEKDEKGKEITEGTLTTKAEKSVEQVIIKAGTPGIIDHIIDANRFAVRFEEGEGKYLVFGNPNNQERYTLLAGEWDKNNRGKLQYGEKTYLTNTGAANVYLKFRMKNLNLFRKNQKVVKGMKL